LSLLFYWQTAADFRKVAFVDRFVLLENPLEEDGVHNVDKVLVGPSRGLPLQPVFDRKVCALFNQGVGFLESQLFLLDSLDGWCG